MRNRTLTMIAFGGLLSSCSADELTMQPSAGAHDITPGTTLVSVEVIGGPRAGAHTLASSEIPCMLSKRFELNLGLPPDDPRSIDPAALTLVSVALQDIATKDAIAHEKYGIGLYFGPLQNELGTAYISGAGPTVMRKAGTGTVHLKDDGSTAVVSLDLQPEPGIRVKGTVYCANIIRF